MIDFEWAGVVGNPMIDLTAFIVAYFPPKFRRENERYLLVRYWFGLISSGKVDPEKYSFE